LRADGRQATQNAMEPQLYMWSETRRRIIDRHNFYAAQVVAKVLAQFRDIETEAKAYAERQYNELASVPAHEDVDGSELAELANDRGQQLYGLLHDLKQQMILGAAAGMFHQWDKDLRTFAERELTHNFARQDAEDVAWKQGGGSMFELLEQFGWNCRAAWFYPKIHACRLVVNVYKHGKGASLTDLAKLYPEYVNNPYPMDAHEFTFAENLLRHEWLTVSVDHFDEFAGALRGFWQEFPERLFLTNS
jgi:hypothetical protein